MELSILEAFQAGSGVLLFLWDWLRFQNVNKVILDIEIDVQWYDLNKGLVWGV